MADVFSKKKRSEVMARIRSRGNAATELALAKLFRKNKITGWRRHFQVRSAEFGVRNNSKNRSAMLPLRIPHSELRTFAVRPDFVFLKSRTAIFVDGCFWHGCPKHGTQPKGNRAFWKRKFARNQARDRLVNRALRRANWRVLRIWEHTLRWATKDKRNEARLVRRIQGKLGKIRLNP
jgi:DNA mismatch endonuclease (patch repair protein)